MRTLDPRADLDAFIRKLTVAEKCALLLDYDGTLAPFRMERDQAFPYSGVAEMLSRIAAPDRTRLVIVSGRPVKEVTSLLELGRHRPEIWGCHGWERQLPDGTYYKAQPDELARKGLALAYHRILVRVCRSLGRLFVTEGHIERKPVGVALHWRGCAPAVIAELHESGTREWTELACETGLELFEFEEGLELRVPARTKADAVETILKETGRDAAVAYLGDGHTDEDAFRALKGKGFTVLVRSKLRPSAADLWLKPPQELLEFLSLWEVLRSRPWLAA